jgi:hypothetical protein
MGRRSILIMTGLGWYAVMNRCHTGTTIVSYVSREKAEEIAKGTNFKVCFMWWEEFAVEEPS